MLLIVKIYPPITCPDFTNVRHISECRTFAPLLAVAPRESPTNGSIVLLYSIYNSHAATLDAELFFTPPLAARFNSSIVIVVSSRPKTVKMDKPCLSFTSAGYLPINASPFVKKNLLRASVHHNHCFHHSCSPPLQYPCTGRPDEHVKVLIWTTVKN